jgi:trehalose 6-phosphate synthase/phosphatase
LPNSKRIFVTNRLPFSINPETNELKRGSGGLVSALLDVDLGPPFKWVGFETDPNVIKNLNSVSRDKWSNIDIHPVLIDKKKYDAYYNKFANDSLWPLFHYETQHSTFSKAGWEAYQYANQLMGDEILKMCGPDDTIWIHDFHFLLLPQILKKKKPNLKVGFFLHIPFPSSEIFRQLPVREEILKGLVACDLIGFQEHSYLRHFVVCLGAFLGIESSFFKAVIGHHILNLSVYPISINTEMYNKKARLPEVERAAEKFKTKINSDFLILGIDRLDYMKGIELKLQGFKRALQKYPELRGRLNLLQIAIPTRANVPAYIQLKNQVEQIVGNINGEFGHPGYTPVHYIYNSVRERELLALYRRSDCMLITSKRDGMNLVAMEYVMSQDLNDPGTLILSEFVGASSLLGSAQIINPWDEDAIADEIHNYFNMPPLIKHKKLSDMQITLSQYSATNWANSFLDDLDSSSKKSIYSPPKTISEQTATWPKELSNKMKSSDPKFLFVDFDGTLVPIQKDPKSIQIAPETLQLLNKLNQHIPVCIISGRPKEFLDQQFQDSNFTFASEHGAFFRIGKENWRNRVTSDIHSWYSEVEKVMQSYSYRVPQSFVEKKEASIVWHYRESPTDFANYQAKKLFDELQIVLANQPVSISLGSKIVEAKAIECNKGNFLRWYMEQEEVSQPNQTYLCIGDDMTDEDMFHVMQSKNGFSIKVGTEKSAANLHLANQEVVGPFLKKLLELSKEHKHS